MLAQPAEPYLEARSGTGQSQTLCHSGVISAPRAQCHFHKEYSHVIVKYYQGFVLEAAHVTLLVLHVPVFRTQLQLLGNS